MYLLSFPPKREGRKIMNTSILLNKITVETTKTNTFFYQCNRSFWALIIGSLMTACGSKAGAPTLFSLQDKEKTGIAFQNNLSVNDTSFNILDYIYYYNGGGVATGDINNDGLIDIFFTSNTGENKLYLNKGNFVFEDISARAGIRGKADWKTGVTMADINGDGLLDIYVCAVGDYKGLKGRNELYINNGNLYFTESAESYGLAVTAFATQATFFDYDKDGDLDMFLVCHSVHSAESIQSADERKTHSQKSGGKLFMNEQDGGHFHFKEVTNEAGIYNSSISYGLSVIIGDFNNDNWDDIYVSNDFHENDYYYINNRNGTFSEENEKAFAHESRFSMGSDAADFNNDGWLDIITMDMLPKDEKVLKSSASDDPLDIFQLKMNNGYHTQYSRNCLQLNTGGGNFFSEVGLYAGIEATDWSWSPLAADFDNDGIKDLFVTNGIVKRPNNLDYIKFANRSDMLKTLSQGKGADKIAIDQMPSGKIANYMFQGHHDMKFTDNSITWGFREPSFSNGAAYADLDNDGDLDIVINNINSPAMLYKNNSSEIEKKTFLDVQLLGNGLNTKGIGGKVMLNIPSGRQLNYSTGSRGFLSSSTNIIHFGLDKIQKIDTVTVIWPSGKVQELFNVSANQRLLLKETDASFTKKIASEQLSVAKERQIVFNDVSDVFDIRWQHHENNFNDFNIQSLIPHMVSTEGPKLAVSDVNKDRLQDFFVCGARDQPSALFIQLPNGHFKKVQEKLFAQDSVNEDVNALFFDANEDGYDDLFVVCGGNEFWGNEKALQNRLYINDGKGVFKKGGTLPLFAENSSVAVAADFDKDGDLDLFVGGRVTARKYGVPTASHLLINDGKGNFTVAPHNIIQGLDTLGMVTDAVWTDKNNDGWPDLVIVGEWMPITVFINNKGKLENKTVAEGLANTTGLWQSIKSADIDNNGFPDLLVGNWGENSKLKASVDYPLELYVGDMDGNESIDHILAYAKEGKYYTFANKEELEKQFPSVIRKRFNRYDQMAGLTVEEIFEDRLNKMRKLSVSTLSTIMLKNNGRKYTIERMPDALQYFPVFAWLISDMNGDGLPDVLAAGNFYGVTPFEGRYDAGYGQLLINRGSSWYAPSPYKSGLRLDGEVRSLQQLKTSRNDTVFIVATNNGKLRMIKRK